MNSNTNKMSTEGDRFIDKTGLRTGVPINRTLVVTFIISVVAFFLIRSADLRTYGETTSTALAFLVSILIFMIFSGTEVIKSAFLIVLLGMVTGLWDFGTVSATFGGSPFLPTIGMMIVAMGCEFTPFGKRLAYWFLYKLGDNPVRMTCVVAITTGLISSFVSNVATLILMSSIAAALLGAMGEKPGESKIGRAMMVMIPTFSMIGGMSLISGAPTGNLMGIEYIRNASGIDAGVSYLNWAIVGFPAVLCIYPVACLIYVMYFKLKNRDINILPKDYYKQQLDEIGPIGGSEIRWIIIVLGMIITMVAGVSMPISALLFATIAMLPAIGCVPAKQVFGKLPFAVTLAMALMPLMGKLFAGTGLGELVSDLLRPMVGSMSPWKLCFFSVLVMGILINVFVNASAAAETLILGIITPVAVGLGYNPVLIMLPSAMIASCFFCFGVNSTIMMNQGYGYWDAKDFTVPGFLTIFVISLFLSIFATVIAPLLGVPLYL